VDQGDRAHDPLVREVRVERGHLVRRQHSLVDNRARRQRGEVHLQPSVARFTLGLLAYAVHDPFEVQPGQGLTRGVRRETVRGEEHLPQAGHRGQRRLTQTVGVDWDLPPAEHGRAFDEGVLLEHPHRARRGGLVDGEEHDPGRVRARRWQWEVHYLAEKLVRHTDGDAGPVACVRLGATRAAVVESTQAGQASGDHIVTAATGDIDDERHPARIVLVPRVIEALGSGYVHRALLRASGGAMGRRRPRRSLESRRPEPFARSSTSSGSHLMGVKERVRCPIPPRMRRS
jgi:hypothetical protein